jgi:CRP-like cAMP-binding protein
VKSVGTKADIIELLGKSVLFNRLDDTQLTTLAAKLRPVSFKRNQVIYLKNEPGDGLYLIRTGRVKISVINTDGKDLIINIYGQGEVHGEMSVFDGLPRSANASAIEAGESLLLSRQAFQELLKEMPALATNIISLLSRRLRYTTEQTEMLGLLGAYERVAFKLLQIGQANEATGEITVNIAQQELAAMLGLTREWLNKVLKIFADQNLIEVSWGKIVVKNPLALKEWI